MKWAVLGFVVTVVYFCVTGAVGSRWLWCVELTPLNMLTLD